MTVDRNSVHKHAQKLLAGGKISQAIEEYLKILRYYPTDWALMMQVGDLYVSTGQSALAIPYFQRVAEHHCAEGFLLKAIAIYKRIHRLDPGRVETRIQLAEVYFRQGLATEARFELLAAVDHYERRRQSRDAIRLFLKLIELAPGDLQVRSELTRVYEREGMISEAVSQHLEISAQWLQQGRTGEAMAALEKAHQLNPRNVAVLWKMLWINLEQNEFAKAARLLEEFTVINPSDPEVLGLIVKSFSQPEQLERMLDLVELALAVSDSQEPLRVLKGELLLRQGNLEGAHVEFVRAIEELLPRGEQNRAIALMRRITRHDSSFYPAWELLLDLHLEQDQVSNLPATYAALADAYIARAMYPDAKKCLQRLLEIEPGKRLHREKLEFVLSFLEIPESERGDSARRGSEDFDLEIPLDDTGPQSPLTLDEQDPPRHDSGELTNGK